MQKNNNLKLYTNKQDFETAQLIETSIKKSSDLNLNLENVNFVCVGITIYSPTVEQMLKTINLNSKKSDLLEKPKTEMRADSASLILFITDEEKILPVYFSAYDVIIKNSFTSDCIKTNGDINLKLQNTNDKLELILK